MNVYKIKRFSRGTNWISTPPPFEAPPEYTGDQELEFMVQTNSNYEREYSEHQKLRDFIFKARIKTLRKGLTSGYIYSDAPNENSNTHCLEVTSKFHYMSKDIDDHNRLTYYIYPPYINDGKLIIKIVLDHCTHHRRRKDSKLYSTPTD